MAPSATVAFVSIILAVDDLPRARAFYDAVLDWPVRIEAPVFVELGPPQGTGIGLYLRSGFALNPGATVLPSPSKRVSSTEIYLHLDDPAAAVVRAQAAGGRVLSPLSPRAWGETVAYVADPDGNVVALAQD